MFNKIFYFLCLSVVSPAVTALPQVAWPGYVDNSECLYEAQIGKPSECGEAFFNRMANHSRPTYLSTGPEWQARFKKIWEGINSNDNKTKVDRIEVQLKIRIPRDQLNAGQDDVILKEDGLPLKTTNGAPTPYLLKGFGAGSKGTFKIEYQKCQRQSTNQGPICVVSDQTWHNLGEETFDKVVLNDRANWGDHTIYLNKDQGIGGIKITTGDPRFRIGFRGGFNSDVRSLWLPSINLYAYISGKNAAGGFTDHTPESFLQIRRSTQTRLNHRQCYLNATPSSINFGQFYLNKDHRGQLGKEFDTVLKLNCGALTEELQVGGNRVDHNNFQSFEKTTVNGSRVVHTVKNVKIRSTYNSSGSSGQPVIGLMLDGSQNEITPNLYVEGSLSPLQGCGINALNIGDNRPNGTTIPDEIKANPLDKTEIPEYNFSTIYWKLCQNPGRIKAGSYSGSAVVTIEYQ